MSDKQPTIYPSTTPPSFPESFVLSHHWLDLQCRWAGPLCCPGNGWATFVTQPSALTEKETQEISDFYIAYMTLMEFVFSVSSFYINMSHLVSWPERPRGLTQLAVVGGA